MFIRSLALATGPSDSLVIRMWSVALVCTPMLFYAGVHIDRADIPRLLTAGVIGMFGYFLGTIFGFVHVTAGVGGIIIATQPLLIALLATATGAEKLTRNVVIGIAISFAGTLFLIGADTGAAAGGGAVAGALMIFASGICWAIFVIASKPLVEKYGTLKITAYSLILCAPPSLLFASRSTLSAVGSLGARELQALFFLSVVATFIALTAWNYAVGYLKPSAAGASLYMIPVLAVLAGWLVLGEAASAATLLAGLVILAGVAVAQFGPKQ